MSGSKDQTLLSEIVGGLAALMIALMRRVRSVFKRLMTS